MKTEKKGLRMKGGTLVAILVVTVFVAGGLTIASVYLNASSTKTAEFIGVLTVYKPGTSSQSGDASAGYNVTLLAKNGVGDLNLTQVSGSKDLIADHSYSLTHVLVTPYNVTMLVSGQNVSLGWVTTSTIWTALNASYSVQSGVGSTEFWNDLNSSYAAASGPSSASNQTIGNFSPSIFQLSGDYNMLLAITIPQPTWTVPFMIAPVMNIETDAHIQGA